MTKEQNPSLCLRVSVESGGCHGFQYLMSLGDMSTIEPEEDTLFVVEEGRGQDMVGRNDWAEVGEGKAKVVMDEPTLELLQGSKVDYTMELIGSQFKIVDNPRATSSCGCGTSFDVKT
jgi:Fe-S cluster assembly iron-binding protein IscA